MPTSHDVGICFQISCGVLPLPGFRTFKDYSKRYVYQYVSLKTILSSICFFSSTFNLYQLTKLPQPMSATVVCRQLFKSSKVSFNFPPHSDFLVEIYLFSVNIHQNSNLPIFKSVFLQTIFGTFWGSRVLLIYIHNISPKAIDKFHRLIKLCAQKNAKR